MLSFREDVIALLEHKGFRERCYALEALFRTVETNWEITDRKIRFYKPAGKILLTLIPILSALLSALIGAKDQIFFGSTTFATIVLFVLSLVVTIASTFNSILKPSQRFYEACRIGIDIEAFAIGFIADLEKRPSGMKEDDIVAFVKEKRAEFEKFQVALIALALPLEASPIKPPPSPKRKKVSAVNQPIPPAQAGSSAS